MDNSTLHQIYHHVAPPRSTVVERRPPLHTLAPVVNFQDAAVHISHHFYDFLLSEIPHFTIPANFYDDVMALIAQNASPQKDSCRVWRSKLDIRRNANTETMGNAEDVEPLAVAGQ